MTLQVTRVLLFLMVSIGALLTGLSPAFSHALQPGYLELRLLKTDHYAVVWKVPAVKSQPMKISAELPEHCEHRTAPNLVWETNAYVGRWTTVCQGGLEGGTISIQGLEHTRTDVLVRYDLQASPGHSTRLTAADAAFSVPAEPSHWEVIRSYFLLGLDHILGGIDHLVFVLALLLLVKGFGRIIATVTAFTVAHSLTLAGATLGYISLPAPPVEAAIALSIVFIATEILHSQRGKTGLTERYPWLIAFAFGLLHGFGFAGALTEIGLPQTAIPLALLFFNLGVEAGQLIFIAAVAVPYLLFKKIFKKAALSLPEWSPRLPPYIIGGLASFWLLERLSLF